MQNNNFTAILCDDENSILAELKEAINWENLNVRIVACASNGKEALDALIKYAPDLAIMDIRMPELNGLDAIANARAARLNTDFIILSGYDDFHYAQKAMHLGARAYLLKPLNIPELSDEIYRILSERSSHISNHMNQQYKRQMDLNFFRSLLDGKIPENMVLHSMLNHSSIRLNDTVSYVMILTFPSESDIATEEICKQLNEFMNEIPHIFFTYKNGISGIWNQTYLLPDQIAESILSYLQTFNLSPLIGIGDTIPTLMQSQYSYSRALTALTYHIYGNGSRIFSSNIICKIPPSKSLADFDYLPLIQYIIKRDLTAIETFCRTFMEELLYVKMPPPNYIFSTCYALLHQVQLEFNQYSHEEISEITSPQSLYRCESLNEITTFLIEAFSHLSEYIDAVYGYSDENTSATYQDLKGDNEIINTALDYIHTHLTDNLKINDIAREVHLSPSYFAIYFKSKLNICLRDYIQQEKMKYARKYLVSPDASINELAYMLGYRDYHSFSRAFKNVHGMTPSDFQNKYKH